MREGPATGRAFFVVRPLGPPGLPGAAHGRILRSSERRRPDSARCGSRRADRWLAVPPAAGPRRRIFRSTERSRPARRRRASCRAGHPWRTFRWP